MRERGGGGLEQANLQVRGTSWEGKKKKYFSLPKTPRVLINFRIQSSPAPKTTK